MLKVAALVCCLAFLAKASAQVVSSYQTDLQHLYALLKQTPSFKDQIKGSKLTQYQQLVDSLSQVSVTTDYELFCQLAHLFFPIQDNHLGFYQLPSAVLSQDKFTDSTAVGAYRASKAFVDYPLMKLNTDSLQSVLQSKPLDSLEGVYHYEDYLTVGVFKVKATNQYVGLVLATSLPHWEKGQIALRLYEYRPSAFRAIYAHPVYKSLMLYPNEKFKNYSLINSYFYSSLSHSVYRKNAKAQDFVNLRNDQPAFQFRTINPSIQYLRIGNFSAAPADRKVSQAFYEHIKDSLSAPHLIVDLRNNTGGAQKVANPFFSLLNRFSRHGSLWVLINNGTMSQAEQFTLRLKKLPRTRTYGQTTMGTLTYGSNYGKTQLLTSGKFQVYLTDMKDEGNHLPYESVGVKPEVELKIDSDWIDQLIRQIEKH